MYVEGQLLVTQSAYKAVFVIGFLISVSIGRAEESTPPPTYSGVIAQIMIEKCVACHNHGGMAPMSLLSYEETRPWAKAISEAVIKEEMPPWDANPAHGKFKNDLRLTESQKQSIRQWVDAGAPVGDVGKIPSFPPALTGWRLGEPDYVIQLPKVQVPAQKEDLMKVLNVPINLPERRWIRAIEFLPGNRRVLHHAVLFTSGHEPNQTTGEFNALAVWAAGTGPLEYPDGYGRWLPAQTNITANMHYHSIGTPEEDETRVGLHFGHGPLENSIKLTTMAVIGFVIPPMARDYRLEVSYFFHEDTRILSWFPHMHFRGKSMKFTAIYPDGRREIMLDVPKYDFQWQTKYYPVEPVFLPANTEILLEAVFDNSRENRYNPDPLLPVAAGRESKDEMMNGFIEYFPAAGGESKPRTREWALERLAHKFPTGEFQPLDPQVAGSTKMWLYVPKKGGMGYVYLPVGESDLWPVELSDVSWTGGSIFTATMAFPGRPSLLMRGTLNSEGKLVRFAVVQN